MGKGAVEGFIPDTAMGTNTDPGYSQRKGMYKPVGDMGGRYIIAY